MTAPVCVILSEAKNLAWCAEKEMLRLLKVTPGELLACIVSLRIIAYCVNFLGLRFTYSVFTFQPFALLLIVVVPASAVCITCQGSLTNCGGEMVDVVFALLSFELNAAGVMIINEGEANCKTALKSQEAAC